MLRRGLDEVVRGRHAAARLGRLGLRFDLTVPLTRFYGNNHAALPPPFRVLQVGPVWRAERPQKGRYRQFTQCDIDMIGEASVLAEVELIEATSEALAAVGLRGTTVRLSDRRFLCALAAGIGLPPERHGSFFISLDKLDKIGWDGVTAELTARGVPAEAVDARARARIESLTRRRAGRAADALAAAVPDAAGGGADRSGHHGALPGASSPGSAGSSTRRWCAGWATTPGRSSRSATPI